MLKSIELSCGGRAAFRRRDVFSMQWPMLIVIALVAMLSGTGLPLLWAAEEPVEASAQSPLPQDKLDSLLAPIALYPDQLLTQALIASTYPLDIVSAARFVTENKEIKGDALDNAVAAKNWDPSVQSLTAYPQVLLMMNDKLEWTQELGDAFLADEKRVMETVQSLRSKAEIAGNLKSNEQQTVIKEKSIIIIEPAETEIVYVPTYNPTIVYGVWWAPMYPPYYYPPPPYYYPRPALYGVIGFSIGIAISNNHWGWCRPHWHGNSINININKNNVFIKNNAQFKARVKNGNWQHNPSQRKGVAYRDTRTREQFRKVDANAVSARRDARGYEPGGTPGRDRANLGDSSPGTRDMQRPTGGGERPNPGGGSETRDIQRTPGGADRPNAGGREGTRDIQHSRSGGFNRGSDARPSFDAGQPRRQAERFSNRGASSRASMGGGMRGR